MQNWYTLGVGKGVLFREMSSVQCAYIGPQFRGVYTHREVPLFAKVRISNTAMHSTVCVCHTVNALGKLVSGNMEPTTTELSLPMHGVHEHMCI